MADDITTTLKFIGDIAGAEGAINSLVASLQKAAAQTQSTFASAANGGAQSSAALNNLASSAQRAQKATQDGAQAALAYAQATARLQVAQGNAAGAVKTLQNALGGVTERTTAVIRAETQLVGVQAQAATAAGKAETAMLREAQALARLQQIAGNTPAAIKTLTDALAKATNPQSLAAIRVQLQKTYLDTNYANSPLIGAIRQISDAQIRQAQSQARLQVAQGNAAGAAKTLETALAGVTNQTTASVAAQTQLARIQRQVTATTNDSSQSLRGVGFALTASLTAPLVALGVASVKSARDIDQQINTLRAFTGSAEAAEKRLRQLIATAQQTPGLTLSLASTLDAQLRVAQVTEQTINRILPAVGRLNAISPLGDPQRFVQNLVQLITKDFARIDLKELVGQSSFAGELIKQIFNVDSPLNSEAIKAAADRLGIKTTDAFFTAFAEAAAKNPQLANVTESLNTQFAKLVDRVQIALRPLGLAIVQAVEPAILAIVPVIEKLAGAFADLGRPAQLAVLAVAAIAAAIGPLVLVLAGAAHAVVAFSEAWVVLEGAIAAGGALAALPALLNPVTLAIAGVVAALGVAAIAWSQYETAADRAAKITVQRLTSQQNEIDQLKQLQTETVALAQSQGSSTDQHARLQQILSRLDPDTRAYIESIGDEKTAFAELNRVLRDQITLKEQGLSKNLGDIGDAVTSLTIRIKEATSNLELLTEQSRRFAESGGKDAPRLIPDEFGRELATGPQSVVAFGEAIRKAKGEIDGGREALVQFGREVAAYIELNKLTVDGFKEQQLALGRSETQVRAMAVAFETFRAQQIKTANSAAGTTKTIDDQRAAIDALTDALDRLNKSANVEVDKRIREIALGARNAAEAKAALKQSLALDDDFFAAVQNQTRVAKNLEALQNQLNPRSRGGGAGREARAARQEAGAELKLLEQIEKEREQATKRETDQLRVALDDRLVSLEDYTTRAIALDENLLKAKLAAFKEEESAAIRTAKTTTEAAAKKHEIELKANQAIFESEAKQAELRRQQRIAEEKAEEEHARRLADIRDVTRRSAETSIRDAQTSGQIGAVEAEQQLIVLERERFAEREALLRRELALAGENLQERQRINDELAKLAAERAAFEVEASGKIQDALRSEAAGFADFIRSRVKSLTDLRRAEIEAQAAQATLNVQRGVLSARDAQVQEFERRRELVRIESLERQRDIERQAEDLARQAQQARLGAAALVKIEQDKNAALKAERERANTERQQLTEQQRAVLLSPEVGEKAALIIAGLEAALERQLTLFERLQVEATVTASALQQELEPIAAVFIATKDAIVQSLAGTIAAFVAGRGPLRAAAAALYAEALKPLKDFLLKKARAEFALAVADAAMLNFAGAAKHTLAGVALSAAAGLIDVGGAAIAGNSGSVVGSALAPSGGSSGFQSQNPRVIEQSTPIARPVPQVIVVRTEVGEGTITRIWAEDYRNNGMTRSLLRRDLVRD